MRGPCQRLDRSCVADAVAMPRTGEIDFLRAKCLSNRSQKMLSRRSDKRRKVFAMMVVMVFDGNGDVDHGRSGDGDHGDVW